MFNTLEAIAPTIPQVTDEDLERETIADWVPISRMFVDKYTRPVGEAQINRMLRNGFSVNKLGMIMLSLRADGRFAILDGNHRVQAARKYGLSKMAARVFIDLSYEQEAELFEAFNTVNRPNALDRFRARIERKELQALEIEEILQRHEMRVGLNGPALGTCQAVGGLDRAYTELGPIGLEEVVSILHDAWGQERRAWVENMLSGMRLFWHRYRNEVERKRLVEQLSLVTPERLLAEAGAVTLSRSPSPGTQVGRTMLDRYNRGLRVRKLADWIDNPRKAWASIDPPQTTAATPQV
jgi:hypothetical protein